MGCHYSDRFAAIDSPAVPGAWQGFTLPVFSGTLAALHYTTRGVYRECRNHVYKPHKKVLPWDS
jgi:hypothetical protein